MEAVSYWTAITSPAAKESCTSLSQPHFVFCFLDTINKLWWWWLCFFETLSQSIEIHFYAAPGGRTRQCQDSFLYRQQLHFTRYRTSYLLYNTHLCSSSIVETLCGFSKALSDDDNPYSHEMLKNISAACVNERDFLWLSTVGVVFFQINTWHIGSDFYTGLSLM
jgi:hypothetical protein